MPAFVRKPLNILLQEEATGQLVRTLGLLDLTAIGIGGTVGSGVFSVVGSVAANDCGPSVILAILIGSVGCLLTGNAYVKLSRAIPSTGSVYAYAYHALGEVFAVICASCLTLEYAFSGSAVAVSWGSKFGSAVNNDNLDAMMLGSLKLNWAAAIICIPCVLILLQGLALGKDFSNIMTLLKCAVVMVIIVSSLWFFQVDNLTPFVPPRAEVKGKSRYGIDGLFRGAVDCFFAFVGFDEVCCLAGEAKNPKKDLPRAVMLSVMGTAIFTFLAALGVVGMQDYMNIDPNDGFVVGLKAHGWKGVATVISIGELVTLPLVVFISFLPQARLFYAMAMDGLMPLMFTRLRNGVLLKSNILIGVIGTLLAMVVDFDMFNDMISAGVLLSFVLCNCSLIMLTLAPVSQDSGVSASFLIGESEVEGSAEAEVDGAQNRDSFRRPCGMALGGYCLATFVCMVLTTGLTLPTTVLGTLSTSSYVSKVVAIVFASIAGVLALCCLGFLAGRKFNKKLGRVWTPLAAILFNSFMLATLSFQGFLIIAGYFVVVLLGYFAYGSRHSAGNHEDWARRSLLIDQRSATNSLNSTCATPAQ